MNLTLVQKTVEKKGIFFLPANDVESLEPKERDKLQIALSEKALKMEQRSPQMYVIKKYFT